MLPGFTPHFYHLLDFLAGIPGVVVVEYIFEHRKIICPFGAVYIVVDGDKADVIGGKDEILKPPHVGIFPAQPGQVFDNHSGYAVILNIFHHLLKSRPLKAGSRISVVYKELDIPKAMLGGILV